MECSYFIPFALCSLLDSIHGGAGHEGIQYQLFASAGAIKFPAPESEAWKEKVYKVELKLLSYVLV